MPIVFVHGVANRKDRRYDRDQRTRDALFRALVLPLWATLPNMATIVNPYWGDSGATPRWNLACLPRDRLERFGASPGDELTVVLAGVAAQKSPPDRLLLETARRDLLDAIDLLWEAVDQLDADPERLADLAAALVAYARRNKDPGWLTEVDDDIAFLSRLQYEVERAGDTGAGTGDEALERFGGRGAWLELQRAARLLRTAVAGTAGSRAASATRWLLAEPVTRFIGDVLAYVGTRGTAAVPGPIVGQVIAALEQARAACSPADRRLVVVGHSLGGVIAYDVLTGFRPELEVDALVSVGSQVGLFEELKLFVARDETVPSKDLPLMPRPTNLHAWINVLDDSDLLAFVAGPIFDGVIDYRHRTGSVLHAHGRYLLQPGFHERLRAHLGDAFREGTEGG